MYLPYTLLMPEPLNKFHSDLHKNSPRKYLLAQTQVSLTETWHTSLGVELSLYHCGSAIEQGGTLLSSLPTRAETTQPACPLTIFH